MISVEVKGLVQTVQKLQRLDAKARLALQRERMRAAYSGQRAIKSHYTTAIKVRSGLLRSSVEVMPRTATEGDITIGTPVFYAATHETGDTMTPRGGRTYIKSRRADGSTTTAVSSGRFLAIPIGPAAIKKRGGRGALTAAGVRRGGFTDDAAMYLSRGRPFSTFIRDYGGKKIILLSVRGTKKLTAIAVLKPSVTVPPRPIWGPTAHRLGNNVASQVALRIGEEATK